MRAGISLGTAAAALFMFVGVSGCRRDERRTSESATSRDGGVTGSLDREPGDVTLPSRILGVVRIPPGRKVDAKGDIEVGPGGRLELNAGDIVRVAPGAGLFVRGGELVAKGQDGHPVVFTSAAQKPGPGDWSGIAFDAGAFPDSRKHPWPASVIEHSIVEFAGHPWIYNHAERRAAGISVDGYAGGTRRAPLAGTVSLKSVEIRNNASRGLDLRTDAAISCENLVIGSNAGVSMTVDAASIERCAPFASERVEFGGHVRISTRLPSLRVPYVVIDQVIVAAIPDSEAAVLTIPALSTIEFKPGADITVGAYLEGALVAEGTTFTSAETAPRPGDWGGILVSERGSVTLARDTFEFGGMNGRPLIAFAPSARRRLEIRASRFRHNAGPAISDPVSCDKWRRPDLGNVFEDKPACRRGPR